MGEWKGEGGDMKAGDGEVEQWWGNGRGRGGVWRRGKGRKRRGWGMARLCKGGGMEGEGGVWRRGKGKWEMERGMEDGRGVCGRGREAVEELWGWKGK